MVATTRETQDLMQPHIRLFDELQVTCDPGGAPLALRPRAQRLLAYLLLHRGRPLSRERIAFALWPDAPESRALATLRRALSELRGGLGAVHGENEWLAVSDTALGWNDAATCRIDVDLFDRAIRQATPAALHRAVELYAGDLLAGWQDEWLVSERERLRRMQAGALRQLIAHHRALAEYEPALSLAHRALALDPLSEHDHRSLIALLYESGDRGAALAAYDRLADLLENEFGVEPMDETRELREAIIQARPLPQGEGTPDAFAAAPAVPEPPVLVGREAELMILGDLWEDTVGGSGALVTVSGTAGVGKSSLLRAFAARLVEHNGRALTGHCYEFEQALPYQGILEMLRAESARLRHGSLSAAHRAALARLAPDLVGSAAAPDLVPEQLTADPRPQLFEALWQAFLTLAQGGPLLLVVEDAHWAAESTLDWLTYVAPRLSTAPILVAITFRTEELATERPLARFTRRLGRIAGGQALDLQPLSPDAHRELVARMSGLPEAAVAPLAARLFEETAGNPLFLHEIVRELIEAQQITVRDGRWSGMAVDAARGASLPLPESVRELIASRIERLRTETRTFIQVAAVAGRVFQYDAVRQAIGWEEETALRALDDALARGFAEQEQPPWDFAFTHHLIQEAIYADLTAPRQRFWHRRLADAIEAIRPDDAESLAHHFGRAGDEDRARQYFSLAGDRARRSAALDDAASYYRAALERWPVSDRAGRAALRYRRGQCLWVLGELSGALEALREARDLYETLDDRLRLGDAERMIGRVYWEQSDRAAALRHYHRALEILEQAGESVELARTISAISQMHMLASEFDEAIAWGARALELAERLGAEDVAIHAEHNVGAALASSREIEHGLTLMRSSLERALAAGLPHDALRASLGLGEQYFSMGRFAEARESYDILLDYARRIHSDFFTGIALRCLIQLEWATGHWAEALVYREQLLEWLRVGEPSNLAAVWAGRILGTLHNDLGQPDRACQALERDLATARSAAELQTTVPHLAELARAYAALGRDADAASVIKELTGWVGESADVVFDGILPVLHACHWLAARPDPRSRAALATCIAWLERAERQIESAESQAAHAEATGLRLLVTGDPVEAAAQLAQAVDGWAALGRPLDQAQALAKLANALLIAGRAGESRAACDHALTLYDDLAAQIEDSELRAAFLDTPTIRALHAVPDHEQRY